MIKCEAKENFYCKDFDKLKNIVRYNLSMNEEGKIYKKDIFDTNKKMADYLDGNNPLGRSLIRIIEVVPDEKKTRKTK